MQLKSYRHKIMCIVEQKGANMNEIKEIVPPALPFDPDDKVFQMTDEENGDPIGDPYSYNDWIQSIKNISGVSEDLLGPCD